MVSSTWDGKTPRPSPPHQLRLALFVFHRKANGRSRQIHTEPFFERFCVRRELDTGHGFMQRGVDEVQPVLIATLDGASVSLRAPGKGWRAITTRVLHHQVLDRGLVGGRCVRSEE